MKLENYPDLNLVIGGVRASGGGRHVEQVRNPATGEVLGELPHATAEDVEDALSSAADGFTAWRNTPAVQRSDVLRRAAANIRQRQDEGAELISAELGKPLVEAVRELGTAAEMFEWAAEECRRSYGRLIPPRVQGTELSVRPEPVGPVAAFAGWNAPAITPARKIGGAVAAGCSIVIKPAETTPAVALFLAEQLTRAGLPDGVLNVLFGDPPVVAEALLRSPITRMVTFTGSIDVGKQLAALATGTMKRTVFELGGHAPVLVFSDVDVEAVVRGAVAAKFRNGGQVCTSPTRFYVHEAAYERFAARFAELAEQIHVGDPLDPDTAMGPLQNARRVEAVRELVDDARQRGASVRAGGKPLGGRGNFFEPTVLTDVSSECRVASEEPFGPVAQIAPFRSTDEAVELANRLPVGLASYVFSGDLRTIDEVTARVEAGNVIVNNWTASLPETPFGGVQDSGIGVEGGAEGLQAFQQLKYVSRAPAPH